MSLGNPDVIMLDSLCQKLMLFGKHVIVIGEDSLRHEPMLFGIDVIVTGEEGFSNQA